MDKECYYRILKGIVQHEDTTLGNIYVPNTGANKYINKILQEFK